MAVSQQHKASNVRDAGTSTSPGPWLSEGYVATDINLEGQCWRDAGTLVPLQPPLKSNPAPSSSITDTHHHKCRVPRLPLVEW